MRTISNFKCLQSTVYSSYQLSDVRPTTASTNTYVGVCWATMAIYRMNALPVLCGVWAPQRETPTRMYQAWQVTTGAGANSPFSDVRGQNLAITATATA